MSEAWILRNNDRGNERECESRAEAEEARDKVISLGASPEALEIVPPGQEAKADGGTETVEPEVVDNSTPEIADEAEAEASLEAVDQLQSAPVDADPLTAMPGHFVDVIQGQPTINKKGYCVLAERFGISVTSEPLVRASETDFDYAEWQATATTEDGREYSGTGSAHVARDDGDDPYMLNEHAETRAMKRAVQWATGVGIVGYVEMTGDGQ